MNKDREQYLQEQTAELPTMQKQWARLQNDWQTMNEAMFRIWIAMMNEHIDAVAKEHLRLSEYHLTSAMELVQQQTSELTKQIKGENDNE